ncbi:hypothetical protein FQA39_LY12037 [Lamprigera yunnana]|nr:hypothetical protein FQA39_LY12037 [Lamprigera yunnana]
MTDTDSDALLLDNIGGKYGDESDYDDLVADEDALLADDAELLTTSREQTYDISLEELDHEPDDADVEDVLVLEAQDVELEDDLDDKNVQPSQSFNSTSDLEASYTLSDIITNREREDKFKNEREITSSKSHDIPDSLDKVQLVSSVSTIRSNVKRNVIQFKNRGRGGNYGNRNSQNQTVLINPHFKGHVKINNNARLAWDARQRISQKNAQMRRMTHLSQNRSDNITLIHPWVNNNNNRPSSVSVTPQFQQVPVYPPPMPQQMPMWNNQYQHNSFNEMPQQMPLNSNQLVIMQPLPQNMYPNQSVPSQFNQPPPQFNGPNFSSTPMYQNPIQNIGFGNQYMPPQNQYSQVDSSYAGYPPVQQNQYLNAPINQPYTQQTQSFNNSYVFVPPKSNFLPSQKMNKRKEMLEAKRKKRNVASTNLHEVHTVETCDTTVNEDKVIDEEEDEETRQYRLKIEEQKRIREEVFREKEKKRLKKAILSVNNTKLGTPKSSFVQLPKVVTLQKNFENIHPNNVNSGTVPAWTQSVTNRSEQVNSKKVIMNNDQSNYDKQHLASFLANRKILAKDQSLIDTSIVVMKNLSVGTTEIKLRKMCQGIGDIKVASPLHLFAKYLMETVFSKIPINDDAFLLDSNLVLEEHSGFNSNNNVPCSWYSLKNVNAADN